MDSAFFDPNDVSDAHDPKDALGYRYVFERERLLLRRTALEAWQHLRSEAKDCRRCGCSLAPAPLTVAVRPDFCSQACDLADRPAPVPEVWDEPDEPPF